MTKKKNFRSTGTISVLDARDDSNFFRKQEGFSLLYVIYYKKMNSKGAQRKSSSGNKEDK
jgi:hypothetical protein